MRRVSFIGVLLGGITDVVATNIFSLPFVIFATNKLDLARASADEMQAALHANTSVHLVQLVIGLLCSCLLCSLLGGYIAALVAKHDELLNGTLSSFLCIAFGIYGVAAGLGSHYLLEELLLLPAGPVFGLLGGYLRLRQKGARVQPAMQ
jgi:hypothetical protein